MTAGKSDAPDRSYRADIDGLRALAILSVVLFHSGVGFFSGGFTGVDIFFVISGYLIGGHIFSELASGKFSFARFYQRRAKRILPAFYFVMSVVILASFLLLSPYEAHQLGRGAFAATLSVSNILFWKTTGYFETRSELNPLLMTWSLGVEEQFYAVIPLLLVLLNKIRRSWLLPAILLGCLVSFLFAVRELGVHPTMVFYMLPARAWELGVGVALAVIEKKRRFDLPAPILQLLGMVGLIALLLPIFLLSVAVPFPGFAALPSVLGTVILLAVRGSWINQRLLSFKPLDYIGKISYSWYLWHWPMLALARGAYGSKLPPLSTASIIVAAFGLAVVSYYFVEQPFRKSTRAPGPLLLRYAVVSIVILAVCVFVWFRGGAPQPNSELATMEASALALENDPCLAAYGKDKPNLAPVCLQAKAGQPTVALWGDSHSAALAPGLRAVALAQGYGFDQLTKASCPPLLGATRYVPEHPSLATECNRFNQRVVDQIEAAPNVRIVVLAGFWAAPFHQSPQDGWLTADAYHPEKIPTLDETAQLWQLSLSRSVQMLEAAGKQVLVIDDVPRFDVDPLWRVRNSHIPTRRLLAGWISLGDLSTKQPPADKNAQDSGLSSDSGFSDPGFSTPADSATTIRITATLRQTLAALPGTTYLDLKNTLCTRSNQCMYRDGSRLLYTDTQHLSADGAAFAVRNYRFPALPQSETIDSTGKTSHP